MRKISAKGYQPFTTGFNEWWVFKHIWQHFLDAAAKDAGLSTSDLIAKFEKGEAKVSDYPELYNNYFDFIDLAVKYGDEKPLETALDGEESAFGTGKAAMVLGQGAWIEADCLSINPDLNIGFNGYPVTEDASQCQVISGSDQALHVNKDSKVLQQTLDFLNWWYTSDYGKSWFTDVAGVVPPVESTTESKYEIIKQEMNFQRPMALLIWQSATQLTAGISHLARLCRDTLQEQRIRMRLVHRLNHSGKLLTAHSRTCK